MVHIVLHADIIHIIEHDGVFVESRGKLVVVLTSSLPFYCAKRFYRRRNIAFPQLWNVNDRSDDVTLDSGCCLQLVGRIKTVTVLYWATNLMVMR